MSGFRIDCGGVWSNISLSLKQMLDIICAND